MLNRALETKMNERTTDPVGIRVARVVIGFFAVAPLLLSLFVIQFVENVILGILLFFAGAAISMGINNRRRWSFYAALLLLALLGLPPAIYLVTATPWYIRDVMVNPHRSKWMLDVINPAIMCLLLGLPAWTALTLLVKKPSREYFRQQQEVSNSEKLSVPRSRD